jgi:GMP synthase-like glutamine amidotransferase
MRIRYFQHVHFGHRFDGVRLFAGEGAGKSDDFDMLLVMGGPMSVHDEAAFPWLREEKLTIAKAVADGKKVLGICLGAQLIAEVLGGEVRKNDQREIGWFPVSSTDNTADSRVFSVLPKTYEAFHWHGESFDIPSGAIRTASSAACANQAFEYDNGRVIGLQFHLEASRASVRRLVENCRDEMVPDTWVSNERQILHDFRDYDLLHHNMYSLLDEFDRR